MFSLCRCLFKHLVSVQTFLLYVELLLSDPQATDSARTMSILLNSVAFQARMTSSRLLIGDVPCLPAPYLCVGVARWGTSASVQICIMKQNHTIVLVA